MSNKEAKREPWRTEDHPIFVQSYGGAVDFASGFDQSASFEAALKFQALFYEKIIVPDGYFYVPSPLVKRVQQFNASGKQDRDDVTLRFLRMKILIPNLRSGESLLENWIKGSKEPGEDGYSGIKPGKWGYLQEEEATKVLETIERQNPDYARWPKRMARSKKPDYAPEIRRLFVDGDHGEPIIGRPQLSDFLGLERYPNIGWHGLFDDFQTAILAQIEKKNFRRGGLEKAIVDHFDLKPSNEVYEFLNQRVLAVDGERWPEVAVAHLLLRISSTVYEVYQAQQFNSIGSLFPGAVSSVVDAKTYSRVVELQVGAPHKAEQFVPARCVDPNKMSVEVITKFRDSQLFQEEYCSRLRQLRMPNANSAGKVQSFWDVNDEFRRFLEETYLRAIVDAFDPAFDKRRLKELGGFLQAASYVTGAGAAAAAAMPTLITHSSIFGEPLFAAVALASGAVLTLGKAVEKGAEGAERYATRTRNAWLTSRAKCRLNGFVAMQRQASEKHSDSEGNFHSEEAPPPKRPTT